MFFLFLTFPYLMKRMLVACIRHKNDLIVNYNFIVFSKIYVNLKMLIKTMPCTHKYVFGVIALFYLCLPILINARFITVRMYCISFCFLTGRF